MTNEPQSSPPRRTTRKPIVTTTMRLTTDTVENLDRIAADLGVARSDVVRLAINDYVRQRPQPRGEA